MTKRYIARGLMADKSAKIEGLLRRLGARGVTLNELRSSISDKLSTGLSSKIREVNFDRNEGVHKEVFEISDQDLRKFASLADDVIFQLELMVDPDVHLGSETLDPIYSASEPSSVIKPLQSSPPHLSDGDREILRKRGLAEVENRRLAKEMDSKAVVLSGGSMSPDTKAKLKDAAIKIGIHMVGSLFKR